MFDNQSVPSYRKHKQSGQAIVTLTDGLGGRRDVLLGKYGTAASRAEWVRVIGEWEASGRRLIRPAEKAADLTMNELMLAYLRHADAYYVKDGAPTSEPDTIKQALRFVKPLYGHTAAKDFGPLALKAVRQKMVEHPIVRKVNVTDPETGEVRTEERLERVGLARRLINKQMSRLKRMFAWAVEEELVPAAVHQALTCVRGLRKGMAREKAKIKTVAAAWVEAVLPIVPPMVKAMIEVQRLAGMRPQEVVLLRPVDLDMSGTVWEYRPHRYKTEHAERERIIFLGPKAQAILRPWLPLAVEAYLFSPARSEDARNAAKKAARKSPMTPSQARRKRKTRPRGAPRECYDVTSYRKAIRRACLKADVPVWCPLQLRHNSGTEVRKRYGLEAAQAVLGHAELGVTQVYAEADLETARNVAKEIG